MRLEWQESRETKSHRSKTFYSESRMVIPSGGTATGFDATTLDPSASTSPLTSKKGETRLLQIYVNDG
jgi:hypothetical protein